jgi:hypothetical protein
MAGLRGGSETTQRLRTRIAAGPQSGVNRLAFDLNRVDDGLHLCDVINR